MAERRLLHLDASGLTAWRWASGRVEALERFFPGERGHAAFADWLAQQPRGALYTLLADVVEEGFELDHLPRARGADRIAMIRRKLAQHFFGSGFTTYLPLGAEKDGRRDERVLMSGLTRPALLDPWLAALQAAEATLTAVHTVPLLADGLVRHQSRRPARFLLVSFSPAGVRQTFFDRGRLRFSRLAAASHAPLAGLAPLCREELRRTYAYLVGQRMIARGETLPVAVLANTDDFNVLGELAAPGAELEIELADLDALGRCVGLATPLRHSDALPLFLHWMVRQPGQPQCAAPELRRFFRIRQARLAVLGAGAAVLGTCLLLAGRQWSDTLQLEQDTAALRVRTAAQEERYAGLVAVLPRLPADVDHLRTLFARLDTLQAARVPPLPTFRRVSRALDGEPALELMRLSWRQASPDRDRDLAPGSDPAGLTVADLRALLPAELASDQRALIERSEGFIALLRAAGTRVHVLRMPLELQSDHALRIGRPASSDARPALELRLAFPSGGDS